MAIGRVFDGHVLDLFEVGIEKFKSCEEFKPPLGVSRDLKPILIFQGEPFENSDRHKRLKNLLIDFFRIDDLKEANISELQRVLVFTCKGETEPI